MGRRPSRQKDGVLLSILISILSAVIWCGFLYAGYRFFRKRNFRGQENDLAFKASAAISSDRHLKSLLEKHPNSPVLQTYYTENAQHRQDWPETLRRAQNFLARCPRSGRAWTLTIGALHHLKRNEEADATLRKALRRLPRDWDVLRRAAMIAAERSDWAEAARLHDLCRRHHPDRLEGYLDGAKALARQGNQDGAAALFDAARARFPDAIETWISEAELAGENEEALELWDGILRRFPLGWQAYLGKARLLQACGRPEEGLALLRQARDFFPENRVVAEALKKLEPPAAT